MKKTLILLLAVILLLGLASCGRDGGNKGEASTDGEGTSQTDTASVRGIVNRCGDFLTLLTEDGEYVIFDFGEGVDPSDLEEGDNVVVSYTGEIGNEEETPVAVSITKE